MKALVDIILVQLVERDELKSAYKHARERARIWVFPGVLDEAYGSEARSVTVESAAIDFAELLLNEEPVKSVYSRLPDAAIDGIPSKSVFVNILKDISKERMEKGKKNSGKY